MARQHETRLEVSAQRFLARRMTHALVRRDVAMLDDPMRAQSVALLAGCLLASIAIAVCGVIALVRPQGVPNSAIVIARDLGALYVRIGDTLHPVLNLASARLIVRSPANPATASDAAIAIAKRGPLVGIPGAPTVIGAPVGGQPWMVCDDERTVVAVGLASRTGLDGARAVLVTPRGEGAAITYLLYEGRRAEVDLRNIAVTSALHLEGVRPLPVSRTLLDLIPEVPAIASPRIEGVGGQGQAALRGNPIGSVVRVLPVDPAQQDAARYYVVLSDGVEAIGEVAADVIRFTYERRARTIPTVSPASIAATPVTTELPVHTYPQRVGVPVGADHGVVICAQWQPHSADSSTNTVVLTGVSNLTSSWAGVTLAQADGEGPNVDAIVMPAGRSAYVRSARIVGDDGLSGPAFLVTDAGVVYGVRDTDAATSLGLADPTAAAPWPVLAQLPRGPELSVDAASVFRDG